MSTEDSLEQSAIPSTTEIIQKAQEQTAPSIPAVPAANPNEVEKVTIKWLSQEKCGGCESNQNFYDKELVPESDVPVEITKIDSESDEGKKLIDDKGLKYAPYVEYCKIFKDKSKEPDCKTINKYDPKFYQKKVNS